MFSLTNFAQTLPDLFSFTDLFPFFFVIIISANSSTRRSPARNQRRVFGTSSNSHKPLWEQRTLSLISFTEDTWPCSALLELNCKQKRQEGTDRFHLFIFYRHEKCGLVSLLVQRDDTRYMASPSLCCYVMAGTEGLEVISSRNSTFALAKHLLSSCGPPAGKYNQSFSKKCDEIWMRCMRIVLCI